MTHPHSIRKTASFIAAALVIAACDAQAPPDYRGEPLLVVKGVVQNLAPDAPIEPTNVLLAWFSEDAANASQGWTFDQMQQMPHQPVQMINGFGGTFEVRIFARPPESAFLQAAPGEPRVALAFLYAVDSSGANVVGWSVDGFVVYFDEAVASGTETAKRLSGLGASAGYHIIQYDHTPPTQEQFDACLKLYQQDNCGMPEASRVCSMDQADSDPRINDNAALTLLLGMKNPCEGEPAETDGAADGGEEDGATSAESRDM